MKNINLIGYACGLGAQDQGCRDAPQKLKEIGIADYLNDKGNNAAWLDIYQSDIENKTDNIPEIIADYCRDLSDKTTQTINEGKFPINVGGDHTMAIGTWSGVTKALDAAGRFGLIWFDAHMDSHTPKTSQSGAYHGMPLACLLGYGDETLCNLGGTSPKISPEHVCLIGIRSYEEDEKTLLEKLNIKIFYIEEIQQIGLKETIEQALKIVNNGTKGYGISIDIDAFDPKCAPGTGSREKNGLTDTEAFKLFANDQRLKALEIAEYNHHRGKDGITRQLILDLLDGIV